MNKSKEKQHVLYWSHKGCPALNGTPCLGEACVCFEFERNGFESINGIEKTTGFYHCANYDVLLSDEVELDNDQPEAKARN